MALLTQVFTRITDANGDAVNGGKRYVFAAGTTTLSTIYSDAALGSSQANPVVADSGGKIARIYLVAGTYKIRDTDSDGNTLFEYDDVAANHTIGSADVAIADGGTGQSTATLAFDALWNTRGTLAFPATQNASGDANTLDDYEEGIWTPTLTFATPGNISVAYTTQYGTYTKIGRGVTVNLNIVTSTFTHTTASGILQVTGLPFAMKTQVGYFPAGAGCITGYTKANYTSVAVIGGSAVTFLVFNASGSGQTHATLVAADMPSAGTVHLHFNLKYEV